ncbi:ribonuclease HI, partial [Pseudomonas syringae pv. tagetis]
MSDSVDLFSDGACKGKRGPGGWGALLLCKGGVKERWGGEA